MVPVGVVGRHRAQRPPVLLEEVIDHRLDHRPPLLVVQPAASSTPVDDGRRRGTSEPQHHVVEAEHQVFSQSVLAIAQRSRHHPGHAGIALDASQLGNIGGADPIPGLQPGRRGQLHFVFPERRQHLVDVTEEHRVRAHQQHSLRPQLPAVRVQQVRSPVQRDRGLAGTGASGHDEHTGQRSPDRFVLLGLDRGHDVTHASGPLPVQRSQ